MRRLVLATRERLIKVLDVLEILKQKMTDETDIGTAMLLTHDINKVIYNSNKKEDDMGQYSFELIDARFRLYEKILAFIQSRYTEGFNQDDLMNANYGTPES
jgi:hypothetical protein